MRKDEKKRDRTKERVRETMRERERERERVRETAKERVRETVRERVRVREIYIERESNKSIIMLSNIKYNYTSVPGNISEIGVTRSSYIISLCFLQQNKIDYSNGRGNFNVL